MTPRLATYCRVPVLLIASAPLGCAQAPSSASPVACEAVCQALQAALDAGMAGRAGAAAVVEVLSSRLLAHYRLTTAAKRLVPPGSALKPFTLLALLRSGKWPADTRLVCERQLRLGNRSLDCAHVDAGLPLEARSALAYSCNFYFARAALALEPSDFAHALERTGLGSRTGLAQSEATGEIRTAADRTQLQLQALGEDAIEVTPLGLLVAYRKLALLRRSGDASLAPLLDGLEAAASYGTGHLARPSDFAVAGKTGTAGSRSRAWTHAWFAGYAPAAAPEIALVVFLEQGRGGADAAPIAGTVFDAYRRMRPLP